MKIDTLTDLYLAELQEARSFEDQIAKAMGDFAAKASDPGLRDFFEGDRPEAEAHRDAIAGLVAQHGAEPSAHEDQTMASIVANARDWAGKIDDPALRDAALIASAQRIQHYEISVYGTLATWAERLGLADRDALRRILDEEKEADGRLTEIATKAVNVEAAD